MSGGTVTPVKTARYPHKKSELYKLILNLIFCTLGILAAQRSTWPYGVSDSLRSVEKYLSNYLDEETLGVGVGFFEDIYDAWNHVSASQAAVSSTGMLPEWENAYKHTVLLENAGGWSLNILLFLDAMLTSVFLMCCYATGIMQIWVIFANIILTFCILDSIKLCFSCSYIWAFFSFSLFSKLSCSIPLLKLSLYYILW